MCMEIGDYEKSLKFSKKAVDMSPDEPIYKLYRDKAFINLENYREAEAGLANLIDESRNKRTEVVYGFGPDLNSPTEMNIYANALLFRAAVYLKEDKVFSALFDSARAVSSSPGSGECWKVLGRSALSSSILVLLPLGACAFIVQLLRRRKRNRKAQRSA